MLIQNTIKINLVIWKYFQNSNSEIKGASSDERALAGSARRGMLPLVACYCRN